MESLKLLVALDKAVDLVVIGGESHTSHMWLARSVLDQRTRIRVDTSGWKKIKPNAICPPMSLISFSYFPTNIYKRASCEVVTKINISI